MSPSFSHNRRGSPRGVSQNVLQVSISHHRALVLYIYIYIYTHTHTHMRAGVHACVRERERERTIRLKYWLNWDWVFGLRL